MTLLSIIIYSVGFITCAWAAFGLILFTFFTNLYVAKGVPFSVKVSSTFVSMFVLPWLLFSVGRLPQGIIAATEPDEEEQGRIAEFLARSCNCPDCRARRGE